MSGTWHQLCGRRAQPEVVNCSTQKARFSRVNREIMGINPCGNYQHSHPRGQVGSVGCKAVGGCGTTWHTQRRQHSRDNQGSRCQVCRYWGEFSQLSKSNTQVC